MLPRIIVLLVTAQAMLLARHMGGAQAIPMAVVLLEGFDHFDVTGFVGKGWTLGTSNRITMVAGRFGGQAASFNGNVSVPVATKTLPSTYSTLICGLAFKYSSSAGVAFFSFLTAAGAAVARARINSVSGVIEIINSAGTLIASGTTNLGTTGFNYIEIEVVVNGASGSVTVHLNGVSEIATTTGNFGSTNIGQISIGAQASLNATYVVDDVYVCDTSGSVNNTFLGDRRVITCMPNGDGAHTAWTPTGGGSHYTQVNEATVEDGDTTYVSDATPGDIDTYTFQDVDGNATIHAIQQSIYARKDDANTRQIAPVRRQSGTDQVGATATLTSTYAYVTEIKEVDPVGSPWTPANFNADEFGVKEIA
jgi:hypothetical protein